MSRLNRTAIRSRIHRRIRKKISGSADRPRLVVHFSNKNIYAQIVDDGAGRTLASASTVEASIARRGHANVEAAAEVGKVIAEKARGAQVSSVVFDRGGYRFHGKVKALADAAREAGLQF